MPDSYRAVQLQNKKEDRSASCAERLENAKKDDPFCLPSSLDMKHGDYSATHKQKTKRRVEKHKLVCLEVASCPAFKKMHIC